MTSAYADAVNAADIPSLPPMGERELALRSAFTDAYVPTANILRTPYMATTLKRELEGRGSRSARIERAFAVITPYLEDAEANLQSLWYPEILPVTTVAAAFVRVSVRDSMAKAAYTEHQDKVARRGWRKKKTTTRFSLKPSRSRTQRFPADQYHVAAAKTLTLDLVQHVTRTQEGKLKTILGQSISKGINADVTGARLANVVGLFPRWQNAVDNFHTKLLDDGATRAWARQRAKQYADSLLDKRGIMIARTELMRAMNDGRLAGWQDMLDRGVITDASIKDWDASPDACDDCSNIRPVYDLDTPFDTPFGDLVVPPLHPHCRCTVSLRPERGKGEDDGRDADVKTINAFPEVADLLSHFGVDEGYWG